MRSRVFSTFYIVLVLGFKVIAFPARSAISATAESGIPARPLAGRWSCPHEILKNTAVDPANLWLNFELTIPGHSRRIWVGRQLGDFEGLLPSLKRASQEITFQISEDVGVVSFIGTKEKAAYTGSFSFTPNASFQEEIQPYVDNTLSRLDLLELCVLRVNLDYIQSFSDETTPTSTVHDILAFRRAGISADYAKGVRKAGISNTSDIVRLRNNGVPAELVTELKAAKYNFEAEDIIRLRNNGISADYAVGWRNAGYNLQVEEMIRLRNHGVSQDYAKAIKKSGHDWSIEEIIRVRNHGVPADYIYTVQKALPALKPDDVVRVRNSGVPADYLSTWASAGYKLSADEIIRLRNSGVPDTYAEALNSSGKTPLNVETIIELRNRGISPDLVRKIRQ